MNPLETTIDYGDIPIVGYFCTICRELFPVAHWDIDEEHRQRWRKRFPPPSK